MSELTITKDNFHILEKIGDNLQDIKNLIIKYLPENYELVLKGHKNLEKIETEYYDLIGKRIILEDLQNLLSIDIKHNKLSLTLNKGLNKLEKIMSSSYNNIIDNCNYLENIKCYEIKYKI